MALLTLQNVGKIYVSDSNVAVGIRGVNLSFDRGEFVAVTGKSGSGKSTLLNVISGMDTYEEGELLVEGEPTSHFRQKDWEEYRKEYISFIFQDYNILESFTVLQNVELALMNIENPKERRERALELIHRVGLDGHIHHKGSKLSGGQKQRTVIARALAKDSPIILADEPTGNLDSQTSAEIIELLREVSHDKLVVVVTHNFEQVEAYATRHIRIYDGAVESDHVLLTPEACKPVEKREDRSEKSEFTRYLQTLRNGLHLGRVRFCAMPKLSAFLCVLMILTSLILTVISATNYIEIVKKQQFTHMDGRVVIIRKDGQTLTDAEVQTLASEIGARSYLHYDNMLDETVTLEIGEQWTKAGFAKIGDGFSVQYGRLPEKENEVALSVPLYYQTYFGAEDFAPQTLSGNDWFGSLYTLTGISYYLENTVSPTIYFTERGFATGSEIAFFSEQTDYFTVNLGVKQESTVREYYLNRNSIVIDFDLPEGCFAYDEKTLFLNMGITGTVESVKLNGTFVKRINYEDSFSGWFSYDYSYYDVEPIGEKAVVTYELDLSKLTKVSDSVGSNLSVYYTPFCLSPSLLHDFLTKEYYSKVYTQASLFFENDREAHEKIAALRERGYIAVASDETVKPDIMDRVLEIFHFVSDAGGWVLTVLFASLFLGLCSSRAMGATRGDIAIMRSMGIPTKVIRISIYVQTITTLIPAFLVTGIACYILYTTPKTNAAFPYLHAKQYAVIALLLIAITLLLSHRYVKKMFENSVKKTLKGGDANE